jgi:hypothetical protein
LPQHRGVDADHGERIAQIVADLRDVEASLAIELAQAVREVLERSCHPADLVAAADERDVPVAVTKPLSGLDDRLELLAVPTARALEEAYANEHQDKPDGDEPLGLDQQQTPLDVLANATGGEHAPRPHPRFDERAEVPRVSRAARRDQQRIAARARTVDPREPRAVDRRDLAACERRERRRECACDARPALVRDAIVDARDDEQADRCQREGDDDGDGDREARFERDPTAPVVRAHERLRGGIRAPTR